jgi:hypothetical protein
VDLFDCGREARPRRTSKVQKSIKVLVNCELEDGEKTTSAFNKGLSADKAEGK